LRSKIEKLEQEANEKDKQIHKLVASQNKPGGKPDAKAQFASADLQHLQRLETQIKFKTDDLQRAEEKSQKLETKLEQLEGERARLTQDRTRLEQELARQADQLLRHQQQQQLLQQQMSKQQKLLQDKQQQNQAKHVP
jgi:hypothetical protein